MAAQFGQAPLAFMLLPGFSTSFASARPLLQAPCNVRLGGGAKPLFERHLGFVPVFRQALGPLHYGGRHLWRRVIFRHHLGPPSGDLGCIKWRPRLVEPGKAPSKTVAPETFSVTVFKKLGMKAPTR